MGEAKRRKGFDPNYGKSKIGNSYYNVKNNQELLKVFNSIKYEEIVGSNFDLTPINCSFPSDVNYKTKQEFDKYISFISFNIIPAVVRHFFCDKNQPNIVVIVKKGWTDLIVYSIDIKYLDGIDNDVPVLPGFKKRNNLETLKEEIKALHRENAGDKGMIVVYLDKDLYRINNKTTSVSYLRHERIKDAWEMNMQDLKSRLI